MSQILICPRGHQYETSADKAATTADDPVGCPVCSSLYVDPPPPREPLPVVQALDEALSAPVAESPTAAPNVATAPTTPPAVPGYAIQGVLGRGGMGVVYKARQLKLNRCVALKMILTGPHANAQELARFRSEAEAVARLQHPNIVQIYEVGEQEGRPYFSLEFVEGGNLARQLNGTPLPVPVTAALVETLARAMHVVHQHGIVHRDLKPANVLLTADGVPKITDFGLVKFLAPEELGAAPQEGSAAALVNTVTGAILGTPSYMAPEQAYGQSREVGPATDVYALGAILYEALTGRPPFKAAAVMETLDQVRSQDPVAPRHLQPRVPRDLETICLKCLHKQPSKRYASAIALAEDLRRFQAGEPIVARRSGVWERGVKWARRRPTAATLILVSALALATLLVGGWWSYTAQWEAAERERQLALEARQQKDLAEAVFGLARDAVDQSYTQVSEEELLNTPGMQPLRKKLLETAARYYEQFVAKRAHDPRAQADLARSLWRLGEITRQVDSPAKGIPYYERALDVFQHLHDAQPQDPQLQLDLASLHNNLGNAYSATGQMSRAEEAYRHALALFERLIQEHPYLPQVPAELAKSYHNLGAFYQQQTAAGSRAEETYHQALRLREQRVQDHPDDARAQHDLAQTLNNLGALYRSRRGMVQGRQAIQTLERAVQLQEKLVTSHPEVADYASLLGSIHENLGLSCEQVPWQKTQALTATRRALEVFEKLVQDHPAVPQHQHHLAKTQNNLGLLYQARGQSAQAESAFRQSVALWEKLTRAFPTMTDYAVCLGGCYGNQGRSLSLGGKQQAASERFTVAVKTLESAFQCEPWHRDAHTFLCNAHVGLAVASMHLGRHNEAVVSWDRAIELDEKGLIRQLALPPRAEALARAGRYVRAADEAQALVAKSWLTDLNRYHLVCNYSLSRAAAFQDSKKSQAERELLAESYAARAMELLAKLQATGYFDSSSHGQDLEKNPDLEPLRSHSGYRAWHLKLVLSRETMPIPLLPW